MGINKKSPVAFNYTAAGGSQPPTPPPSPDDHNVQRSPRATLDLPRLPQAGFL